MMTKNVPSMAIHVKDQLMTVTLYLQKAEPVLFYCKANKGSDNIRGPPLPATKYVFFQILTQACYCFAKCSNSFEQGAHPW